MKHIQTTLHFFMSFLLWGIFGTCLFAQTFEKVSDTTNPVVTTVTDDNYSGAAWIDIDNDGDLDLFVTKNFLFRNLGNGNFERVNNFPKVSADQLGNGTSWADYDNDGDPDLFLSGTPSLVYRNDGSGNFEPVNETPLGTSDDNRGWTGAWADYNNDGFVDLVIVHPNGYLGSPGIPCRFFKNNGDGRFTKIDTFQFTSNLEAYTVPTWSDYDQDGDEDLFIGSGPINHTAVDFLYNNTLANSGKADLERITTSPIATDMQQGQVWNWIDYDNDGDLDAFLTNYNGVPNRFYKNENGTYVSITNNLTIDGYYLGSLWGDLDNDGDLDVILTNESNSQLFRNDGNDTFTLEINFAGRTRGSALGDYNNDGYLDFYRTGPSTQGLYKNTTSNNDGWVTFTLKGSISNYSAIGAKVKLKANINGNQVWQYREVSAQNNFNGHNSQRVHFGLGNASAIDSVIIIWPSGQQKYLTNLAINKFYTENEEIPSEYLKTNFKADSILGGGPFAVMFTDLTVANSSTPVTSWEWDFNNDGSVDATDQNPMYTYTEMGSYTVRLVVSNGVSQDTLIRDKYITITSSTTGIGNNPSQIPDQFSLAQNYPNPFNPTTKIKYSIPTESNVVVKVYDLLGKEVATLVNGEKKAGFYELTFGNENLPSGIYIYRITTGNFTSAKKMLLIK
ncbi:MAG TPA: FG-GAP-like repeat-containing protein [Ignavibacteriaceae bacterium]|nr:FG-GAP-like repeat-containing protein [Ignavibacteriaceae bacterium]